MKRRLFTFALAALTVGLLGSCSKINERIDDLDKRVYDLENNKIASIEQQIAAINTSINELKTADVTINGKIADLKTAADAQQALIDALQEADRALGQKDDALEARIATLEGQVTTINGQIDALVNADIAINTRIDQLQSYVDTEIGKAKDWATASFASLTEYQQTAENLAALSVTVTGISTTLAGMQTSIAELDTKIDGIDVALQEKITTAKTDLEGEISDLKTKLEGEIADAIAASETSLQGWVNEQLSAYYTAAQMDAEIDGLQNQLDALKTDTDANKSKIEELKTKLDQLEEALEEAKTTIKAEYKDAIATAINDYNGTITQTIQTKIDEVNATIAALTGRVEALESDVATLKNDVAALKAMIQTVSIIPAYNNGSVKAEDGILTINCVITPKEAVESLTKKNFTILTSESEVLTKSALYGTLTIAKDEDLVLDKSNGTATIKVDVSSVLPAEEGKALTVAVNIKNGLSDFTTEFVPVTVTTKPIVTVTFDLNGITGTAPETQKVAKDGKVTKPTDPTDMVHTFAGWYKTKDATTGALSDPWDFDNDTVTADMTLYAKWTRTLESIYTNSDIPKVEDNTAPDNAWVNGDGGKAFIAYSTGNTILTLYKKLEPSGAKQISCKKTELFTKIGDDYVFSYGTQYGVFTLHMTEGKFTSVTYDGTGTTYEKLSGTYTAAAPLPAGALKGVFSVSADKKVHFSQGNLVATIDANGAPKAWKFATNQYDHLGTGEANKTIGKNEGDIDLFGWSTASTTYGISTSNSSSSYSGDFVDWGKNMGDGNTWRTLSEDEWAYLFNARTASTVNSTENARYAKATVNSKAGVILLPDTYAHPEGVTLLISINTTGAAFTANTYDLTNWKKMESAGAVFLPAAGYRNGSNVNDVGVSGSYWSSTASGSSGARRLYFKSDNVSPYANGNRYFGYSVRLITESK